MSGKADPVIVLGRHVWALRLGAYILATYGLLQALAIILGGDARFSGAGYSTAMSVPGAPPVWGWTLLPFAIAALFGIRTSCYLIGRWALFAMGVWSFVFAISFLVTAIRDPSGNLTAIFAYGKDAVLFILISVAYRFTDHDKVPHA